MTTNTNKPKPTQQQLCDMLEVAANLQRNLETAQKRGDVECIALAEKMKADIMVVMADWFAR